MLGKAVAHAIIVSHVGFLRLEPMLAEFPLTQVTLTQVTKTCMCVASKDGIRAYASRALIYADIRYAQIEKALIGIIFACELFHQFINSETDQHL